MFREFILKLWIVQDPLGVPCPSFSSSRNSNNPTQLRHLFFHRGSHVCLSIWGGVGGVCAARPQLVSIFLVCLRLCAFKRRVWYVCVLSVGISQAEEGSGGGLDWNLQLYRGNTVTECGRGFGRRWGQTDRWTDSQEGFYQHWGDRESKRCTVPVERLKRKFEERGRCPNSDSVSARPCPCPCLTQVSGCQRSRTMCKPMRTSERSIKVTTPLFSSVVAFTVHSRMITLLRACLNGRFGECLCRWV